MDTVNVINNINEDLNWRVSEIASIKSLHLRNQLNERDCDIAIRANIPLVYAIWEGFVVKSFTELMQYIEKLEVDIDLLNDNLVTYVIDSHVQLHNARNKFDAKCRQVNKIREVISGPVSFSGGIDTESNVNFKVLKKLANCFLMDEIDSDWEGKLNKLLKYRNSIAHGDQALPVDTQTLNELSDIVRDIMYELLEKLVTYIENRCYLN